MKIQNGGLIGANRLKDFRGAEVFRKRLVPPRLRLTVPGFFSRESQKLIHGHLGREDADHIAFAVENGIDTPPVKRHKNSS